MRSNWSHINLNRRAARLRLTPVQPQLFIYISQAKCLKIVCFQGSFSPIRVVGSLSPIGAPLTNSKKPPHPQSVQKLIEFLTGEQQVHKPNDIQTYIKKTLLKRLSYGSDSWRNQLVDLVTDPWLCELQQLLWHVQLILYMIYPHWA